MTFFIKRTLLNIIKIYLTLLHSFSFGSSVLKTKFHTFCHFISESIDYHRSQINHLYIVRVTPNFKSKQICTKFKSQKHIGHYFSSHLPHIYGTHHTSSNPKCTKFWASLFELSIFLGVTLLWT